MTDTKPYDRGQWRTVGGGWWLHALAVVAVGWFYGLYPLVAFTCWLAPSGLSRPRRVWMALGRTLLLFVPFAWLWVVPWSRRWYFLYRVDRAQRLAALAGQSVAVAHT